MFQVRIDTANQSPTHLNTSLLSLSTYAKEGETGACGLAGVFRTPEPGVITHPYPFLLDMFKDSQLQIVDNFFSHWTYNGINSDIVTPSAFAYWELPENGAECFNLIVTIVPEAGYCHLTTHDERNEDGEDTLNGTTIFRSYRTFQTTSLILCNYRLDWFFHAVPLGRQTYKSTWQSVFTRLKNGELTAAQLIQEALEADIPDVQDLSIVILRFESV
jgi:hypothetical protein